MPEQMLNAPQRIATLHFATLHDFDMRADAHLAVTRTGTAHGLCAWFDSTLAPGIRLSNAPGEPALIYGNAFFPWPEAVCLDKGDSVAVRMRADLVGDEYVWTWNSDIIGADGRPRACFRQSDFLGEVVSPTALRKRGASHVPVLSVDGEAERAALEAMQGRLSVADIARDLAARFPQRFTRLEEALAYVGDLAARFSR
jgi:protein arginine N-methyltransferase 1